LGYGIFYDIFIQNAGSKTHEMRRFKNLLDILTLALQFATAAFPGYVYAGYSNTANEVVRALTNPDLASITEFVKLQQAVMKSRDTLARVMAIIHAYASPGYHETSSLVAAVRPLSHSAMCRLSL